MSKTDLGFDADGYAPVAERIRLFYERYPLGRIDTRLVSRTEGEIVFKAVVYRTATDEHPAATGWAAEREGDGDINLVACLENTETSAIGRALANLGFTASRQRPSAEEMAKASRARACLSFPPAQPKPGMRGAAGRARHALPAEPARPSNSARDLVIEDLVSLIHRASRVGLRPARAERWRSTVVSEALSMERLTEIERRLGQWVARQLGIARA
ncbi:MAG TPA: hypothetical protein VJU87_06780 [Gemmatimonadaceae bacterium]|nr:hypothetical protein [Gemmatimonadaceae bacterium]